MKPSSYIVSNTVHTHNKARVTRVHFHAGDFRIFNTRLLLSSADASWPSVSSGCRCRRNIKYTPNIDQMQYPMVAEVTQCLLTISHTHKIACVNMNCCIECHIHNMISTYSFITRRGVLECHICGRHGCRTETKSALQTVCTHNPTPEML